jgi:hypothetical protein
VSSAPPPAPGQLSPDGKYYWDGERWVPEALAAEEGLVTQKRGAGYGCLAIALILVFIAISALSGFNRPPSSRGPT